MITTMSKTKIISIIVASILALAALLGLLRSNENDFTGLPTTAQTGDLQNDLLAFYKKGQELRGEKTEPKTTSASFLAVGDIILSRKVALKAKEFGDPELPFLKMAEQLKSADFAFGNLESPLAKKAVIGGSSLVFGAATSSVDILKKYNFEVLNLANNHALDQLKTGLDLTIQKLNDAGIKHMGTGSNIKEAWQPAMLEKNGIKICFVGASYSSVNDGGKIMNDFVARIEDIENLKLNIEYSKSLCDFVVATMHAGTEYTRTPNQSQIDFAHSAIDYGADIVIGAHPHWVQTIERYCAKDNLSPNPSPQEARGIQETPSPQEGMAGGEVDKTQCPNPKYIFYSLGNFIFDQEWSQETKEGLALKIQISRPNAQGGQAKINPPAGGQNELQGTKTPAKLDSIELIPVIIENFSTPRPATPEESKKILEKIGEKESTLK